LISCSPNTQNEKNQVKITPENAAWTISVLKWEITDNLEATESVLQYNGDVTINQLEEKPSDGFTFLLIKLEITKVKPGSSAFIWKNLYISDSDGNKYQRLSNDTFLDNYNLPRIKSTDLTLGSNEGYICVEIPNSVKDENLSISYESTDGKYIVPLN